ncbi:hypothetical protein H4219_000122 [Mycoemilia scoparia]|uniref:WD40 repeat-like protein n=1 Tax=Mycoemilia scoparia TaxID=417184 RepID=A0A9W8A3U7_9FUNG|nr:hypothetical protein H4219_000122 [Mycoemilia scoparia]
MPLTSSDVNYLVYRYLKESGFLHSSYIFQYESQIHKNKNEDPNVDPGLLIRVLQKGLQYMEIEKHLNEDGTARLCDAPFNLLGRHVCSYSGNTYPATKASDGHQQHQSPPLSRNNTKQNISAQQDGNDSSMDIDAGGTTIVHTSTPVNTLHTPVSAEQPNGDSKTTPKLEKNKNENADSNINTNSNSVTATATTTTNANSKTKGTPEISPASQHAKASNNGIEGNAQSANKHNEPKNNGDAMDVETPTNSTVAAQGTAGKTKDRPKTNDGAMILRGHDVAVFMSSWNTASSRFIATGGGDGTARIWDLSKISAGEDNYSVVLQHLPNLSDKLDVTAVTWNSAGTLLATVSYDGQIRIWTQRGELRHIMRLHQGPVVALKWNKKGDLLLSGSLDKTIILWDTMTGDCKQQFEEHSAPVLDIDWLDNATFASGSQDRSIMIWKIDQEKPIKKFVGHKGDVNTVKWHSAGKYLASASDDGTAKVWSMDTTEVWQTFTGHTQQVYAIEWMPRKDRAILATGSFDGTIRIWDADNGNCLRVISSHSEAIHCIAFSPDGRLLASGAFDKKIRIAHLKNESMSKSYDAEDGVYDVQWSSNGALAASIANGTVMILEPYKSSKQ